MFRGDEALECPEFSELELTNRKTASSEAVRDRVTSYNTARRKRAAELE